MVRMGGSWVLALVSLAACGRLGFDDVGPPIIDAPLDAPAACRTWGPFGAATRDTALSFAGGDDWSPRISRDGLTLLVDRYSATTQFDPVIARRTATNQAWSAFTIVADLVTPDFDQAAQLSADNSALYLLRTVGTVREIWQYDAIGAGFGNPRRHPALTGAVHFWISDDELRALWIDPVGATTTVYQSSRPSRTGLFDAGVAVLTFLGANSGVTVTASTDELEMFLGGPGGGGRLDVLRATRSDRSKAFGTPDPIVVLETPFDETVGSTSADGTTLYLNLDTDVGGGRDADIWTTTRSCLD